MIKIDNYDVYHVGVSGGKDSQALLLWAVDNYPHHKIDATFCDTGNEHCFTYEHIEMMSKTIHPITTLYPDLSFFDLAKKKGRFPSPCARFCTQQLKIVPTKKHINNLQIGKTILMLNGIRANESISRSNIVEKEYDRFFCADVFRPLLNWSLDDVWEYLEGHDSPRNPLYDLGMKRVGCFPCIMSNKAELKLIANQFPEYFDRIREYENKIGRKGSTFFSPSKVPLRFRSKVVVTKDNRIVYVPTIDDIIRWVLEDKSEVVKGSITMTQNHGMFAIYT